ncbi:MAG: S41 family peptidase [Patescibacteria group bacterium]
MIRSTLSNLVRTPARVALIAIAITSIAGGVYLSRHADINDSSAVGSQEPRTAFILEVFDTILSSHWEKLEPQALAELMEKGIEKLTEKEWALATSDRAGAEKLFTEALTTIPAEKQNEFTATLGDIMLANLKPFGRSRLYSKKEEQKLQDTVLNKDTGANLYSSLGIEKSASTTEVAKAYEAQRAQLATQPATPETEKAKAELERAFTALQDENRRARYDEHGVEPTVTARAVADTVGLVRISQVSPLSFEEFKTEMATLSKNKKLASLVIDLRGNIGGAVDTLQYFLGPFIGAGQYAYDFFHQGEPIPFRTRVGWLDSLVQYKRVVVLIDGNTQSSGEVMAAALKKYNVGILVGVPTKGWGTIEQVMPLKNQFSETETYSLFLVHSLTLREDNEPIEGRGVDPTIDIRTKGWEKELTLHWNDAPLTRAVQNLIASTER